VIEVQLASMAQHQFRLRMIVSTGFCQTAQEDATGSAFDCGACCEYGCADHAVCASKHTDIAIASLVRIVPPCDCRMTKHGGVRELCKGRRRRRGIQRQVADQHFSSVIAAIAGVEAWLIAYDGTLMRCRDGFVVGFAGYRAFGCG